MKALSGLVALLLSAQALACGVCVEDKIAACYDHAVIQAARGRGQEVAFFAVQGALSPMILKKTLESIRGVQAGTVRVSVENAAVSFAYDPRRTNAVAVADAMEKRTRLGFGLLKIMDR